MAVNRECSVHEEVISGIQTVTLENALLRAQILTGKGADIYALVYKPLAVDVLLKAGGGLAAFEHRNLTERRLKHYSELFTGGWQDCLPHRARYLELDITQDTGGIAATVPWAYEIVRSGGDAVSIRCFVRLPDVPFEVEKSFTLRQGEAQLYIEQRIRNEGTAPVQFSWTQHAAFGGQFLDEHVSIEFPGGTAFHARQYDGSCREDGFSRFEEPIDRVTMPDGPSRDLRQVPPRQAHEQIFTVLTGIREPRVMLINREKRMGVQLEWELDAFPYIRYWSCNTPEMYTVGIEPSNDAFANFDHSLQHGTYRELLPGQAYATRYACRIFETC